MTDDISRQRKRVSMKQVLRDCVQLLDESVSVQFLRYCQVMWSDGSYCPSWISVHYWTAAKEHSSAVCVRVSRSKIAYVI